MAKTRHETPEERGSPNDATLLYGPAPRTDHRGLTAGAVRTGNISDHAVRTNNIAPGAVTAPKVDDSAIEARHIRDGVIEVAKFAQDLRPVQIVTSLPTLPNPEYPEGAVVFLTTDGKLYRNHEDTWTVKVETVDLDGQVIEAQIADNAVSTAKIVNDAITEAKVAAGSITETKIADDSVTTPKLTAGAVVASHISAGAVTTVALAADAVVAEKIAAEAVTANELAANSVTAVKIDANAVTANKILAGAVVAGKIATNAVTTGTIAAGAVTTDELAANSVNANKIAANAVGAQQLAAVHLEVGKFIRSTSYVAGSSGWAIDASGNAEFNDVTVRGISMHQGANGGVRLINGRIEFVNAVGGGGGTHWMQRNASDWLHINSSTVLNLFGGERVRLITPLVEVTGDLTINNGDLIETKYRKRVRTTTTQSLPNNAVTTISYNSTEFSKGTGFTNISGGIRVPEGLWLVTFGLTGTGNTGSGTSSSRLHLGIEQDGNRVANSEAPMSISSIIREVTAVVRVPSGTSNITSYIFHNSGSSSGNTQGAYLTVARIGPS